MAYSSEIITRAKARLEEARQEREAENAQHQREAYARYPRLKQIDQELRRTMAEVAKETLRGGDDRAQRIAAIRNRNLELQREREWLLESSDLEEGYLDDSPVCPVCGGSGYSGGIMCECLKELCRQEQKKELAAAFGGSWDSFDNFRLSYYSEEQDPRLGTSPRAVMTRTLNACRNYAQNFTRQSGNLLLSGETGLGKTMLSMCIARVAADRGCSVCYESAAHLVENLQRAHFQQEAGEAGKACARYQESDLLIVDDLGTEMVTQFTLSALYTLINDRLMKGLPMIVSTNLNTEDFARRYSSQIASRLTGSFRRLTFIGTDVHQQKGKKL